MKGSSYYASKKLFRVGNMSVDHNIHVLVVDYYSRMRRIIINLLSKTGFNRFSEAENGIVAINKLKAHRKEKQGITGLRI